MPRVQDFAKNCPKRAKIGKTHANVGTKEISEYNMDKLMSTLEIDSDADYLFEGFAMVTNIFTKSYLEAAFTTTTQADRSVTIGRSAKAFHQHNRSIPTSCIILDNHSTVDVFCNPTLLRNIRASDRTLNLSCNDGTIPVNQAGDLPGYGRVWYHPKGISSILRLSNVTDNYKYWVHYGSQESKDFIVTRIKDSKETRLCRDPRGLHWLDTNSIKNF